MMETSDAKKLPKGITRRSDGRYMGRFQYEGQRYTLYDASVDKLLLRIEDMKYELRHGIYEHEQNITLDKWFHTWMEEYKKPTVKLTTYELYLRTYEHHIKPHFKGRKLKDIKPENIQRLLNLESKKLSKKTLSRLKVILNGVFSQAYKNEMIKKNPVPLTQFPKYSSEKERRVMSKEEQNIFLKYVRQLYYGDIFEVALSTGMRNGELRGLEWTDVDFEEKMIHVNGTLVYSETKGYYKTSPKTRSSKRDIPMLDNVYTILKERQERQLELKELLEDKWKPYPGLENLVFCKENGNLIEPAVMQYYIEHIQEMIKRDGIKFAKISVHTLRHTFATRCIENGMQPQVLKSILGHSSLAMTMDLYSHVLPDTKSEEMKKISGLF